MNSNIWILEIFEEEVHVTPGNYENSRQVT